MWDIVDKLIKCQLTYFWNGLLEFIVYSVFYLKH